MKDSRTPWVTLLRLVLALSDAIVLEQIELLDFQKSQRLCMYLCVMDSNGYSMIWDPQWFDSFGHFLPSHRYALCALPSAILSVHLDAIHFAFPTTLSLPRWVIHWVHVWGKKKQRKTPRRAELPLWETEIPSSRAQGFKIRLVMEKGTRPSGVKHSATLLTAICNGDFGVSGSTHVLPKVTPWMCLRRKRNVAILATRPTGNKTPPLQLISFSAGGVMSKVPRWVVIRGAVVVALLPGVDLLLPLWLREIKWLVGMIGLAAASGLVLLRELTPAEPNWGGPQDLWRSELGRLAWRLQLCWRMAFLRRRSWESSRRVKNPRLRWRMPKARPCLTQRDLQNPQGVLRQCPGDLKPRPRSSGRIGILPHSTASRGTDRSTKDLPKWIAAAPFANLTFMKKADMAPRKSPQDVEEYSEDDIVPTTPEEVRVPDSREKAAELASALDALTMDGLFGDFGKKATPPTAEAEAEAEKRSGFIPAALPCRSNPLEQEKLLTFRVLCRKIFDDLVIMRVSMDILESVVPIRDVDEAKFFALTHPRSAGTGLSWIQEGYPRGIEPHKIFALGQVEKYILGLIEEKVGFKTPLGLVYSLIHFSDLFGFSCPGGRHPRNRKLAMDCSKKSPESTQAPRLPVSVLNYLEKAVLDDSRPMIERVTLGKWRVCIQASIRHSDLAGTEMSRLECTKSGPRPWAAAWLGVSAANDRWLFKWVELLLESVLPGRPTSLWDVPMMVGVASALFHPGSRKTFLLSRELSLEIWRRRSPVFLLIGRRFNPCVGTPVRTPFQRSWPISVSRPEPSASRVLGRKPRIAWSTSTCGRHRPSLSRRKSRC